MGPPPRISISVLSRVSTTRDRARAAWRPLLGLGAGAVVEAAVPLAVLGDDVVALLADPRLQGGAIRPRHPGQPRADAARGLGRQVHVPGLVLRDRAHEAVP